MGLCNDAGRIRAPGQIEIQLRITAIATGQAP
jgi:hypothetical protein